MAQRSGQLWKQMDRAEIFCHGHVHVIKALCHRDKYLSFRPHFKLIHQNGDPKTLSRVTMGTMFFYDAMTPKRIALA